MSDYSWKTGDRVQLKSGGPIMTVKQVLLDDVTCVWWEESKKRFQSPKFPAAMLTRPAKIDLPDPPEVV